MQNTPSVSVRLIFSASVLTVLSACGGGGGSSNSTPPPAANTPPVIAAIGAQSVAETETLNFIVTATDADATTPDLTANGLPTGATFNPADGTFNWAPVEGDADNSPYTVTFIAADEVDAALTVTGTVEIAVTAAPITADCTVGVTSPAEGSLQAAGDPGVQAATATLDVEATLSCTPEIPAGWGVKLSVAGANNGSNAEETVTSAPFITTLTGLSKDEYALTATVVDDAGADVSGVNNQVVVNSVGLGDYYIAFGDSITRGKGDNFENGAQIAGVNQGDLTSADGRTSGGYPALLNDDLTNALGYPHLIINAGYPGINSADGLNGTVPTTELPDGTPALSTILAEHPTAQRVLVMFGMNDARTGAARVSTADFTTNMQSMIDVIVADGKEPVLARVNIALADRAETDDPGNPAYPDPNAGSRSLAIRDFNTVINQLVTANASITITAPNFYNLFYVSGASPQRYESEYSDFIHPDRTGYQSMTNLWVDVLTP